MSLSGFGSDVSTGRAFANPLFAWESQIPMEQSHLHLPDFPIKFRSLWAGVESPVLWCRHWCLWLWILEGGGGSWWLTQGQSTSQGGRAGSWIQVFWHLKPHGLLKNSSYPSSFFWHQYWHVCFEVWERIEPSLWIPWWWCRNLQRKQQAVTSNHSQLFPLLFLSSAGHRKG